MQHVSCQNTYNFNLFENGFDFHNVLFFFGFISCNYSFFSVAGQNNPVTSQVNLQRQMSAPAKLSLSGQYSSAGDVSFQGQITQSKNITHSGQNQQFTNFQPPFQ